MNYKTLMGYGKKKTSAEKKSKIKTNKILESIRGEFDLIGEGPAADYNKDWSKIKKTYGAFWDSVKEFESTLHDKGLSRDAKKIHQMYDKQVGGFFKFLYKTLQRLI